MIHFMPFTVFSYCTIWDRLKEEVCQLLKVPWEWSQTALYGEMVVIGGKKQSITGQSMSMIMLRGRAGHGIMRLI